MADEGRFFELSADFAASMVTGFGRVNGATVGFVANQNSKDEGRLTVYGCKKAARFVHFCDSFSIPVVTVVDSMGMKVSAAPQGELSRAASQLLFALTEATTPRLALIAGNAVGMGYVAQASRAASDVVYAWPGAVISTVTPKIAAQLLYADEMKAADDPAAKRAEMEQRYCDDVADGVKAAQAGLCGRRDRALHDPGHDRLRSGNACRQARSQARQEARQHAAVRRPHHEHLCNSGLRRDRSRPSAF